MRSREVSFLLWVSLLTVEARLGANSNARGLQDSNVPILLSVVGNNGNPETVFPLGECEGDCDNDEECDDGLYCMQRSPGDYVPGCRGSIFVEADYCVQATSEPSSAPTSAPTPALEEIPEEITVAPTDIVTEATTTVAPTEVLTEATSTMTPTELATELMTTLSPTDLATTLVPTELETMAESTVVPTEVETLTVSTIAPTELETMTMTTYNPSTLGPTETMTATDAPVEDNESMFVAVAVTPEVAEEPLLVLDTVGNDGNFPNYPLFRCQGDCDVDDDCAGELVCFQRVMDEDVPGCLGPGDFSIDYCTRPNPPQPTLSSAFEAPFEEPAGVVAGGALEMTENPVN